MDNMSRGTIVTIVIVVIIAAIAACVGFTFVERVDPGNAAVLVDYLGGTTSGQAAITPMQTGRFVWVWPTQRLAEYPIAQQTLTMVRSEKEGQVVGDDSVGCQDINGIPLNVDSSALWRVDSTHVGELYLLRPDMPLIGKEGGDISSTVVRREVRNAITLACSKYRYDQIFGVKRVEFGGTVTEILAPSLTETYVVLDKFLLGEIHLRQDQADAINRKALAEQAALEAAFLQEKAENEANALIAKSEGEKQAAILRAEAEAQSIRVKAEAQAEAIRIINTQLGDSQYYITYVVATNWNGVLPTTLVTAGGEEIPLLLDVPLSSGVTTQALEPTVVPTPVPATP